MAIATTRIAPSANEMKVLSPLMNMPAIATITVTPEISTARPEVAAAASSAPRSLAPGGALLALASQVEQRVVDARPPGRSAGSTAGRLASTGRSWLGSATRPSAAITAVMPISSGTPAATSVPNVIVRMISVTGRDSSPAFARSSVMVSLIALSRAGAAELLDVQARVPACTAATAARLGSTRSLASVESPAISKFDQRGVPVGRDLAAAGQRRLDVLDVLQPARGGPSTSSTAARNSGSLTVSLSLWTNTTSSTGRRPARRAPARRGATRRRTGRRRRSASCRPRCRARRRRRRSASQPQIAFLRCRLLQAAMRAARLCVR